jgi:hypothetical protein
MNLSSASKDPHICQSCTLSTSSISILCVRMALLLWHACISTRGQRILEVSSTVSDKRDSVKYCDCQALQSLQGLQCQPHSAASFASSATTPAESICSQNLPRQPCPPACLACRALCPNTYPALLSTEPVLLRDTEDTELLLALTPSESIIVLIAK